MVPAEMTPQPLTDLRRWMRDQSSAIVAYSGGVDSAVVMAVAHAELGDRALACIGVSPSYPRRELRDAVALAERLGANLRTVDTEEHLNPSYAANPTNRCYFCKSELFGRLTRLAKDEGWGVVLDGTNTDDLGDVRPGRRAAEETGVRSPLMELGINKAHVRAIARHLGLPVWDKPAMACLSSRVPHGTAIDPALLKKIESAEDALAGMGFAQFRVRHHGEVARIELPADDLPRAIELREVIVDAVRAAGYRFVSLDLAGFRSGGLVTPPQFVPLTTHGTRA